MISVFGTSNKPFLWKQLYENISNTTIPFEMIFTGPSAPEDWQLPSNFKYIKTNVKPSQAQYAAGLYTQGEHIICIADDATVTDKFLDVMMSEFLKQAEKDGNEKISIAPLFYDSGKRMSTPFIRSGSCKGPFCCLNAAIVKRSFFIDEIGSFDRGFLAAYAQVDMSMRIWESGGKQYCTKEAILREQNYARLRIVGCRTVKNHDRPLLTKLWHKQVQKDEVIHEEDIWGYYQPTEVISKKRMLPVEPFDQNGILEHSQGFNIPDFGWD